MIVDGRAIAEDIYKGLAVRRARLRRGYGGQACLIRLGIVVCGTHPVIESFVRIKARAARRLDVEMVRHDLPKSINTRGAIEVVGKLAADVDAIIVQLPLPKGIDTDAVLSAIPPEKDIDAINPEVASASRVVEAPVALAVVEILTRGGVAIQGARAVVVGSGRLVGAPCTSLLQRLGARVLVFTLEEGSIDDLKNADIVVLGAGNPGFIKPEHLKAGVALIDAGASESAGKIRGDADPACAKIASLFTPVPGGVGPIAVAMIFRNVFDLLAKTTD